MDINLEKIELVKDRTGATYAEAKEALEKADGSVVDAIIDLEEKMNKEHDAVDGGSLKDSPIFAKMKDLWNFMAVSFPGNEKQLKAIRKSRNGSEYKTAVRNCLR